MDMINFLERGDEYFIPNLSIDLVIIGYRDKKLRCLLLKLGDKWMLPGGYIRRSESVDEASARIMKERTSLENPYLRFLSVFGKHDRQFREEWKEFFETNGQPWKPEYWINNRFVTLAYYSLVNIATTHPAVGELDEAFTWSDFDELPAMWMDHATIIASVRERLKEDIKHEQVTYNLLPEQFTMPELHQLHQTILKEDIDRSRFQKKMLSTGLFERLPRLQKEAPGRNPYLYRVKGN